MATKDLITSARAVLNLQGQSNNTGLLAALITSVSDAIQKYCRRDFSQTSYDELYNGNGQRQLLLRQYPLVLVTSVRYRPVTVLKVTNTNAANVQARVLVTSTGLELTRTNNGVGFTENQSLTTFSGNATLSALATAINGIGNGWSAQYVGDSTNYGSWPSADLYWPPAFPTFNGATSGQGSLQCVAGSYAELKMHTCEMAGYQWDSRGWLLRAIPYTDPELLHPEDLVWPVGINNLRVQYTAGYSTVPEAVQEACAEWVAALYFLASRDPLLSNQLTGAGAASGFKDVGIPANVQALLAPYRRHTVSIGQS